MTRCKYQCHGVDRRKRKQIEQYGERERGGGGPPDVLNGPVNRGKSRRNGKDR